MEKEGELRKEREGKRQRGRAGKKTSRGGGWENALAGYNRLQAVPGPRLAGNLAASTQPPGP